MRRSCLHVAVLVSILVAGVPAHAGAALDTDPTPRRVRAEGLGPRVRCNSSPSETPVGTGPCPGARPGALIRTDEGGCTMNFIFRDRKGHEYAGTAGHCTLSARGEAVWDKGTGPLVEDGDGKPIGRFVYALLQGSQDFGLIRLFDHVESNPEMCHFGGPTGIDSSTRSDPFVVQYFGNGSVVGNLGVVNQTTVPARSAVAPEMNDRNEVVAAGVSVGGDSGAPVTDRDHDRAIGVLVAAQGEGIIVITRIGPVLAKAEAAIGAELTLRKAG